MPHILTIGEIETLLAERVDHIDLKLAYSLSRFLRKCLLSPNFIVPSQFDTLISLSEHGEHILEKHPEYVSTYGGATVKFTLFVCFTHHDFLINLEKCDLSGIQQTVNLLITSDQIRIPWIFGRKLYNHFFQKCTNNWIDHIPAEESWSFLDDQRNGICQYGTLIFGPLGILHSSQERCLPILRELPLWHCSDVGCMNLHEVSLEENHSHTRKLFKQIKQDLTTEFGKASPWDHELNNLIEGETAPNARKYYDVSTLIAECFTDDEKAIIFERSLQRSCAKLVRQTLKNVNHIADLSKGSPRDISGRLKPEDQTQILFVVADADLVNLLDQVVFEKGVFIPPNEERSSRIGPPKRYFVEKTSVISSLGIKEKTSAPLVSLCALIWAAYESTANLGELSWRIRSHDGIATKESLMQFIRSEDPEATISKLILASEPITNIVVNELQYYGNIESPDLITHLMWKFGFNVSRYSDTYHRFRTRLDAFQEALTQVGTIRSENDREKIRSAGVNLFVSFEQILDEIVSYNSWLFASDHFITTRNVYNLSDARLTVPQVLGSELSCGSESVNWNINGENTMGTLLRYLDECASWLKGLLPLDRSACLRAEDDMPHYADHIERDFAFMHTMFWADVAPGVLAEFVNDFSSLVKKFQQANVPPIRNGIDHQRTAANFPDMDAMRLMAGKLREAFDHADLGRYVPKEFWLAQGVRDKYGRSEYFYQDYLGRKTSIHLPEFTEGTRELDGSHAIIIPPGALLGQHAALTFGIRDSSAYSDSWKDYPLRRSII